MKFQKILEHNAFANYLEEIEEAEKGREFCCHGLSHLLDVARIAYLHNLEKEWGISKDVIYGAALLHDIGKPMQYKGNIPHEVTGAQLCQGILKDCGYEMSEIELIKTAILHHRKGDDPEKNVLSVLLYEGDKASRNCMFCKAAEKCKWKETEKNKTLHY